MAKKKLDIQAILDNPEQLADLQKKAMYKANVAKFKATLAADPDIIKKRTAKRRASLAANPDIINKARAKRMATRAKKQELHTPYGVFAFKKDAAQALVGQYGFSKNKTVIGQKIGKLIKTNL